MNTKDIFGLSHRASEEEHWLSISDMMAGLMIVFLFIAITYIRPIVVEQKKIQDIAVTWKTTKVEIQKALEQEFKDDLLRWNAELVKSTLTLRFKAPDVLFDTGKATLKQKFKKILKDFFPRYLNVLDEFENKGVIAEIRIEGHTSSEWEGAYTRADAYFRNMELSQSRTRVVLEYCLKLDSAREHRGWARRLITANGLSSSQLIYKQEESKGRRIKSEDPDRSRRVEFRVRTKVTQRIEKILEEIEK